MGLSEFLLVLGPGLALVVLDCDPTATLSRSVLADLPGVGDFFIFRLLRVDWLPDGVEAPTAATLDEYTHGPSMNEGHELTLVAKHADHNRGLAVVVNMEGSAWRQPTRVPNEEPDHNGGPGKVSQVYMAVDEVQAVHVEDGSEDRHLESEDAPVSRSPGLHRGPGQNIVLHRPDVQVSKLEAQEHEASDPHVEVPVENFFMRKLVAGGLRDMHAVHIVPLINGLHEQDHVIIGVKNVVEGIVMG